MVKFSPSQCWVFSSRLRLVMRSTKASRAVVSVFLTAQETFPDRSGKGCHAVDRKDISARQGRMVQRTVTECDGENFTITPSSN